MLVAVVLISFLSQCLLDSTAAGSSAVAQVSFSLRTDTTEECDTGLTNAGIFAVLDYELVSADDDEGESEGSVVTGWQRLDTVSTASSSPSGTSNSSSGTSCNTYSFSYNFTYQQEEEGAWPQVRFRLLQWEHGGGFCSCWGLVRNSFRVTLPDSSLRPSRPLYAVMLHY